MTLREANSRLLAVVGLALALATPALAGWPSDSTSNVMVSTTAALQDYPAIVSDGAGGAIVAWSDDRSGHALYVQRISSLGVPLWTSGGVALCTGANPVYSPTLLPDGAGGALVVWQVYTVSASFLYAQRVSSAGIAQWTTGGVALTSVTGWASSPVMTSDGGGGAIVAWMDSRTDTGKDIYAQRISAGGTAQWAAGGVALCSSPDEQSRPSIVSDDAGGAIVTWHDYRSGDYPDVYSQRVSASGATLWTANGVAVCALPFTQYRPVSTSDGAGGAIVTWMDYRDGVAAPLVYTQRVAANGTLQWTPNGVLLSGQNTYKYNACVVPDGSGGAIVAWVEYRWIVDWVYYCVYSQRISAAGAVQWTTDGVLLRFNAVEYSTSPAIVPDLVGGAIVTWADIRNTTIDLYAQRISPGGTVQWAENGVPVSTAAGAQLYPCLASDGAGGTIAAWKDSRDTGDLAGVYAQRVDRWGHLGVQPAIVNVRDIPNDQGGQVSLFWNASPLDAPPSYSIGNYWIWRQVPSALAQSALARGARVLPDGATSADARHGVFRTTTSGTTTFYWELVDAQIAQGFPGYSYVAPTACDSVAAGNPCTVFMVEARGALAGQWWFSDPDSGYSVDNLAPAAPSPFTGEYADGTTTLHWGVSSAADFVTFRLYRGHDASFVPGPSNLVVTKADTGYVDVAGGAYFYQLAAVDVHGNVSPYALLQPSGTVDVPGADGSRDLALSAPAPNPMRGSCSLRLALPRAAQVALAVYDQQGRRVRTLLAGALPAGEHPVAWDGRDDAGRPVASALYFVRLETGGRAITRRLVVVR